MMDRTEQQITAELANLKMLADDELGMAGKPLAECSPKFVADLAIEAIYRIQLALGIDLEKFKTEADEDVKKSVAERIEYDYTHDARTGEPI